MNKNYFISMQKGFLALMSVALLFSCSSIEPFDASELVESQELISVKLRTASSGSELLRVKEGVDACAIKNVDLVVGNDKVKDADGNEIGEVTVYKDNEFAYVTA
jgi:hypothetical protein